jgi:hypothetical protein
MRVCSQVSSRFRSAPHNRTSIQRGKHAGPPVPPGAAPVIFADHFRDPIAALTDAVLTDGPCAALTAAPGDRAGAGPMLGAIPCWGQQLSMIHSCTMHVKAAPGLPSWGRGLSTPGDPTGARKGRLGCTRDLGVPAERPQIMHLLLHGPGFCRVSRWSNGGPGLSSAGAQWLSCQYGNPGVCGVQSGGTPGGNGLVLRRHGHLPPPGAPDSPPGQTDAPLLPPSPYPQQPDDRRTARLPTSLPVRTTTPVLAEDVVAIVTEKPGPAHHVPADFLSLRPALELPAHSRNPILRMH